MTDNLYKTMTKLYRFSISALILPVAMLVGCQTNDTDISMEDGMSADSIQQQISAFQSDLQTELQQIDNELSEVEQNLTQAGDTADADMDVDISELRQERQEIEQNLQSLTQETTDAWHDTRSDIRRRVDALAVDVSRARMKAADTIEEFKSVAQEELTEIESNISRYESQSGQQDMATNDGMNGDGMSEDMAQDEPMPNAEDQRVDPMSPGLGDGPVMGDNDAMEWQEEHQELAQNVEELDTAAQDEEFVDQKDELADAIADLNAEVRQAVTRVTEGSDFVQAEY